MDKLTQAVEEIQEITCWGWYGGRALVKPMNVLRNDADEGLDNE